MELNDGTCHNCTATHSHDITLFGDLDCWSLLELVGDHCDFSIGLHWSQSILLHWLQSNENRWLDSKLRILAGALEWIGVGWRGLEWSGVSFGGQTVNLLQLDSNHSIGLQLDSNWRSGAL